MSTVCRASCKMRVVGLMVILFGLLANKWAIESVLSPDAKIESIGATVILVLLQLWVITAGVWLLMMRRDKSGSPRSYASLIAGLSIAILAAGYANLLALN